MLHRMGSLEMSGNRKMMVIYSSEEFVESNKIFKNVYSEYTYIYICFVQRP